MYSLLVLRWPKQSTSRGTILKVLFFDIIEDLGLIEASPPWYSPTKPQPLYEGAHAQAYWDVPYGEQELMIIQVNNNNNNTRHNNNDENKLRLIERHLQ